MYSLLPLVIIVIAFWFLLIRPQQKRQAKLRALQSELTPGDRVMLTSGIFGTVMGTVDEGVLVQVADGVTVTVIRGAIGQVLPKDEPEASDADAYGTDAYGTDEHDADEHGAGEHGAVDLSKPEES